MPQIFENPISFTVADDQVSTRGSTNGTLANITDFDFTTYYETRSPGTIVSINSENENQLTFTLTSASTSIDTLIVLATGIKSIRQLYDVPGSTQIFSNSSENYSATVLDSNPNGKNGFTYTEPILPNNLLPRTFSATELRLRLLKTSPGAVVQIYNIFQFRTAFDLRQSNSRAITRFETSRQQRNAYVIEALDGTRSLQTGPVAKAKRMINYSIWENSLPGLGPPRNRLNGFYQFMQQNRRFLLWDLNEPNSQDFESIFWAHWVPNSFQERIEAQQAISYSFTVEEQ